MLLHFQTGDPIFASACASLGCPVKLDPMEHKPAASAQHNKLYKTWHIGRSDQHDPHELYSELTSGNLAKTAPAHPIFAALAALESFNALIAHSPFELSLVPFNPPAFNAKTNRICTLRPPRQNDGNLNPVAHMHEPKFLRMAPQFAAVAAVCGFPFYSTIGSYGGMTAVLQSPGSTAFPGLSLLQLIEWFNRFAAMANPTGIISNEPVTVAHTLPGFPPGEHPAHYALIAIKIFQAYLAAHRPASFLFTNTFSALVPTNLTPAEQDQTMQFLLNGASALL